MAQSLTQIYVHIIFGTKGRVTCLDSDIREQLWPYLATTLSGIDCNAKAIGGTADHVHILSSLSKNISVAYLVESVKTPTSRWLKTKSNRLKKFHWQAGYAAFSVSHSGLDRVRRYIANQERHHQGRDFQDEVRAFLRRHGVAYDEKYLWD